MALFNDFFSHSIKQIENTKKGHQRTKPLAGEDKECIRAHTTAEAKATVMVLLIILFNNDKIGHIITVSIHGPIKIKQKYKKITGILIGWLLPGITRRTITASITVGISEIRSALQKYFHLAWSVSYNWWSNRFIRFSGCIK